MLLQLIINVLQPQGNTLRILFLIPTILFTVSVLYLKCFPGHASFACAVFSGAAYPVFLFFSNAVHPFSDHQEGTLRLAFILEILLLALSFWNTRAPFLKSIVSILCTYFLSWFFFSKIPVSFTAMSDFLYLIVPCAAVLFLGIGAADEEKEEDPVLKELRLQAEFEIRNRGRNKTEVNGVEIYSDPDGTVREARDQYGMYIKGRDNWADIYGNRLSRQDEERKGLDRYS